MGNLNNIYDSIKKLESVIQYLADDLLIDEINELKDKIQSEKFYIVVLGLFKRGKSSFLNALLGIEILPTAVTPLTSIITFIEFGEKPSAEVLFKDKTKKNIPIGQVKDFIAEKENPKNKKNVLFVRIMVNSNLLHQATFIDTPGIGSTLEHNTDTTYNFVDKIDAAVFLLSADIPITPAETNFLKILKKRVPKIIFLFNKIDLLSYLEIQESLDYNISIVKNIVRDEKFNVIPVSGRKALEAKRNNNAELLKSSNIERVQEELRQLIENNKEEVLELSNKLRFKSLLDEVLAIIKIRLNSLLLPLNMLEERLNSFQKSINIMNKDKEDFDILMDGKTNKLQRYVFEEINKNKVNFKNITDDTFINKEKESIIALRRSGIESFQKELYPLIIDRFNELREVLEKEVKERFTNILISYKNRSDSFLSELFKNSGVIIDFNFDSFLKSFDLKVYTDFYYKFDYDFTSTGLKNILFIKIMPYTLIKHIIFPKLISNLNLKIEANCGGINYDINYKIQESYRKFKFDLNKKFGLIISRIENIIKETIKERQNKEINIYIEKDILQTKIDELISLKNEYTYITCNET